MMVTAPENAHLEPAKAMRWLQIVQTSRYRLLAEFHFPDSAKIVPRLLSRTLVQTGGRVLLVFLALLIRRLLFRGFGAFAALRFGG